MKDQIPRVLENSYTVTPALAYIATKGTPPAPSRTRTGREICAKPMRNISGSGVTVGWLSKESIYSVALEILVTPQQITVFELWSTSLHQNSQSSSNITQNFCGWGSALDSPRGRWRRSQNSLVGAENVGSLQRPWFLHILELLLWALKDFK